MKGRTLHLAMLLAFTVIFTGCAKDEPVTYYSSGPDMPTLKKQYKLAVIDAKVAEPYEIFRSLTAVVNYGDSLAGQGNLVWSADSNGRWRIKAISWMRESSLKYWPLGQTFSMKVFSWITTAPQMLNFLKKNTFTDQNQLHLRIAQVMGMPPDSQNDYFVEFWVYPENLFRPAPDPEITDHEADLYFPSWVSQKHRTWFQNELQNKYDTSTTSAFPWTRLGYTYDWADPLHPVGLSEFVVDTASRVTVAAIYSSWEYYKLSLTMK